MTQRWAYLGPEGTFTEQAVRELAGRKGAAGGAAAGRRVSGRAAADDAAADDSSGPGDGTVTLEPAAGVSAAIASVRRGDADAACVPLENSVEGAVALTQDELAHGAPLTIAAEAYVPVTFQLLGRPGARLATIRTVGSHPHALAQTREYVAAELPGVEAVVTSSTAAAAEAVAAGELDAAIAAPVAAARYRLTVLADDIGTVRDAVTRFVLLRLPSHPPPPSGNDRTSMVLTVVDRPGSLLAMLTEFATRGINLTRLESRPTRAELGKYLFLVDADGHVADHAMADVLAALVRHSALHRFLGSYPRMQGDVVAPPAFATDAKYDDAAAGVARMQTGEFRE